MLQGIVRAPCESSIHPLYYNGIDSSWFCNCVTSKTTFVLTPFYFCFVIYFLLLSVLHTQYIYFKTSSHSCFGSRQCRRQGYWLITKPNTYHIGSSSIDFRIRKTFKLLKICLSSMSAYYKYKYTIYADSFKHIYFKLNNNRWSSYICIQVLYCAASAL